VNIPDFSPVKLATIAEDIAREEKGCTFEDQLWEKLAEHIGERYEDIGAAGNARLSRKLIENADRWREDRVFSAMMAVGSGGVDLGEEAADTQTFIASDFNMEAKLVEEKLKIEVDKDIRRLIGMDVAKRMFAQSKAKVRYVEKTGEKPRGAFPASPGSRPDMALSWFCR
jgi:hypothetical protein